MHTSTPAADNEVVRVLLKEIDNDEQVVIVDKGSDGAAR